MPATDSSSSPALLALREFLKLVARPPRLGEGLPEGATPLLRNLWYSWNRRHLSFQWILQRRCRKLRPRMQALLEWALTECYLLTGLPPHDGVNLAVQYAREQWGAQEAGFANGVLRGILREAPPAPGALEKLWEGAPESVRWGLPEELWCRWRKLRGAKGAAELAALLQKPAPVTARRRGSLASLPSPLSFPEAQTLFQEVAGETSTQEFYLQDPSTMLAPALLDPRPGETLADLCAAPGGKSVALAERMQGKGRLLCADSAPPRMSRLQENLKVFPWVTLEVRDATQPQLPTESLDGLLLDVPCSNTGVLRRRPDVRRNFTLGHLRELTALQERILDACAPLVRPGGRMVYSTCSIEPEENHHQVAHFLERHPEYALEEETQLLPQETHDGAYAARLRKS